MLALDLYCGAGGASMGMWRSGVFAHIVGVDIEPQPDYPFDFVQADVSTLERLRLDGWLDSEDPELDFEPDFVWASPPCQRFSPIKHLNQARNGTPVAEWDARHPDLVPQTRALLRGHPWTCIENIPTAPIRPDIVLEGGNVGIRNLKRRRHFEVSWETLSPKPFQDGESLYQTYGHGGMDHGIPERRRAMGLAPTTPVSGIQQAYDVDWCDVRKSLNEMIPPAYASYIIADAVRHGFGKDTTK